MRQLTAATVHQAACGHWLEILQSLSGNLAEALQKPGRHVTCPVHGGKDGFRFFKDAPQKGGAVCNTCGIHSDGFSLLMWLNGWSFSQALHEVARYLKLENYSPRELKKVFAENRSNHGNQQGGGGSNPKRDAKLAATIERIWGESLPYSCEAARPLQRYLSTRRIVYLHDRIERSDSLRFHPSLSYFHGHRQHTCFPAILGAIRDRQGQLLTLQRIYLSKKGGKANVINPKKMLPFPSERTLAGAAIPLGAPELGVLGVAD